MQSLSNQSVNSLTSEELSTLLSQYITGTNSQRVINQLVEYKVQASAVSIAKSEVHKVNWTEVKIVFSLLISAIWYLMQVGAIISIQLFNLCKQVWNQLTTFCSPYLTKIKTKVLSSTNNHPITSFLKGLLNDNSISISNQQRPETKVLVGNESKPRHQITN